MREVGDLTVLLCCCVVVVVASHSRSSSFRVCVVGVFFWYGSGGVTDGRRYRV